MDSQALKLIPNNSQILSLTKPWTFFRKITISILKKGSYDHFPSINDVAQSQIYLASKGGHSCLPLDVHFVGYTDRL
jgi:hypothetical protein